MAIYRNISLSFWDDNKVVDDFTPEDRYFYLYLLTNPHTNLIGCYEVSLKQMSNETGYNVETVERLLDRMQNTHEVIMYSKGTKEILIKNWSKYNWTRSEKLLKNVENVANYVKNEGLKNEMQKIIKNYKKNKELPESSGKIAYPMYTSVDTDTDSVSVTVSDTVKNNINNLLNNNKNIINLFYEYLELRKNNKLSISKTVIDDLLNFLKDKDDKQREKTIKKAIKNGWKDFYPIWEEKKDDIKYETV